MQAGLRIWPEFRVWTPAATPYWLLNVVCKRRNFLALLVAYGVVNVCFCVVPGVAPVWSNDTELVTSFVVQVPTARSRML